jgi:hypothetical protein
MPEHFFAMDVTFLYRIAAMAAGLILAWGLLNVATWRQRREARSRREAVTRANPDYWSRPARIRRGRRAQAR